MEEGHMRVSEIFSTGGGGRGGCGGCGGGCGYGGGRYESRGWYGGYGGHGGYGGRGHDYYESGYHRGGRGRDREEFLEIAGIGIL
jgi:hypothetical protein